mmetsp:Transcript_14947/g.41330  ORF Transcript_14947/g.41330 Transcript_14947/m.41330 type:complete len:386 (+) Transcript_14947:75-1232(+)
MCLPDSPRKKSDFGTSGLAGERTEHRRSTTTTGGQAVEKHGLKGRSNKTRHAADALEIPQHKRSLRRCHSSSEVSSYLLTGTVLSVFFVTVTPYLPYLTYPQAAEETFHFASYDYEIDLSHFDNTAWTWATDYGLAVVMGVLVLSFPSTRRVERENGSQVAPGTASTSVAHTHTWRSQAMLLCYLTSVLCGGLAHQFYTTLESRSSWSFRVLWTLCVGSVTLAPAFMGSIATELHHLDHETSLEGGDHIRHTMVRDIPMVPTWFWAGYAICSTWIATRGGMSYQRPACDICIAGVTQTPCTLYLIAIICFGLRSHNIPQWTRFLTPIAYLLNAPLFPLYPVLIQYTDWSLASVNTLLHTWLLVSWTTQGIILRRVAQVLGDHKQN